MDAVTKSDEVHRFELSQFSSSSYIGLVLLNVLLNIVTLTLYRFWGKTAIRRRLWAETSLNGESFEYSGRGMELFVGFLIATFTVFLPIILIFSAAQMFLDPVTMLVVILPMYVVIGLLAFSAIFLTRRYQLSRTQWRGIRLGMDGSPWGFGLFCLGQVLLTFITLGWWGPAARQRVARRLWRSARFGDVSFEFGRDEGETLAGGTYLYYALGWIGSIVAVVLAGQLAAGVFAQLIALSPGGEPPPLPELLIMVAGVYAFVFGILFAAALAFLPYQVAAMRRTASLLTFGEMRFALRIKALGFLWLLISNVLIFIFTLGLLAPLTQIRSWRYVVGRLEVHGSMALARVTQSAALGPRSGEGLADGLDFGGV
jgi:uncharacterized membrane protein YjgN (DUF898 family)